MAGAAANVSRLLKSVTAQAYPDELHRVAAPASFERTRVMFGTNAAANPQQIRR